MELNKTNGSFVSLFPSEVLDVVFHRLSFRECIKCTSVCQSWNAFLFSWPGLWFEISDQCCSFEKDLKAYQKSLPWDHVQRLSIKAGSLDYISRHLPKNVHTATLREEFDGRDIRRFCMFVGSTLTTLKLEHGFCNPLPEIVVDTILQYCPYLQHLTYYSSWDINFIPVVSLAPLSIHEHPLERLEMDFDNIIKLDALLIKRLIPVLPNLRHIRLNSHDLRNVGDVLDALARYCPRLETTVFSDITTSNPTSTSSITSTSLLCLRGVDRIKSEGLATFLSQYDQRLETLELHLSSDDLARSVSSGLSSLGHAQHLKRICLTSGMGCFKTHDVCVRLVSQCPHLEEVSLAQFDFLADEGLQALSQLEHLESLSLSGCLLVSPSALVQFVEETHSKHCLRQLNLDSMLALTDKVLDAIGRNLIMLERLQTTRCFYISDTGLRYFVDSFSGSSLREFVFGQASAIQPCSLSREALLYAQSRLGSQVTIKEIIC
ncbi:predicted protein [Lichtheimia corymbifera JMRC:FSU:9682]|uniref:F-box domain-containing protein n=1 Tax=Lichtheimia corymbifera JMRC:FSU:9682 TaxID=1263082 RepID=A0A068RKZ2_9FUNG|nr:predicted protein [Lichtheimia corymbifera JMRC:FSU:9682]